MSDVARVGIFGAGGRMGRALIQAMAGSERAKLAAAVEYGGNPLVGQDAAIVAGLAAEGVPIEDDPAAALGRCDVMIDFSTPKSTVEHAKLAAEKGIPLVVGTTGLAAADETALARAGQRIAVVYAANYSVGMTLLADLVQRAASRLGTEFDIEIVEMHHRNKVDSPSGSALMLGRAAAGGRGVELNEVAVRGRDGVTGARAPGAIGFASLRGGDVPGDHSVIFAGEGERLELTHRAGGRMIFARGAVQAALWVLSKPAGLYSMRDVLGLGRLT